MQKAAGTNKAGHKRRNFLKIGLFSSLAPILSGLPKISLSAVLPGKGILRLKDEGEVYQIRPNSFVTIKVSMKADGVENLSFCTEEFMPGEKIPIHKHLNEDEIIFIHKGKGTITLGDDRLEVETGGTAFVPKGTWHGLENTGTESLIMVFGYNPSGFEDFFRQAGTPKGQEFKTIPPADRMKLAEKQGMIFKK